MIIGRSNPELGADYWNINALPSEPLQQLSSLFFI
jgi:hypothetical protein